jgi:hypothetical protein
MVESINTCNKTTTSYTNANYISLSEGVVIIQQQMNNILATHGENTNLIHNPPWDTQFLRRW